MGTKHTAFDQPYERKVHLYHDQQGATIKSSGRLFANTACKMNSDVPQSHITTDLSKVTCSLCLSKKQAASRFQSVANNVTVSHREPDEFAQWCLQRERMKLADGRHIRYRRSWRGKLILQVQSTTYHIAPDMEEYTRVRWRDATLEDLSLGVV